MIFEMEPEKVVLDWCESAVEQSVLWLVAQSKREEFIDLSHLRVLTQTSGGARRIKESLAQFAKEKDSACLLPVMSTPGSLIKPGGELIDGFQVASALQSLAIWTLTLKGQDLSKFENLFPQTPEILDVSWGLAMARAMISLRETLAEANYDCESVEQSRLTEKWGEQDRWSDLARLEKLYRERMQLEGMLDPMDARRRGVHNPIAGHGIERVVLLGVSGFPDLVKTALENLMKKGTPVNVVVFCPRGEENESFDPFGRPICSAWESRPLDLSDEQLHLTYDPREQARLALDFMDLIPGVGEEKFNIGVLDAEVKQALSESEETRPGQPVFFDPEGEAGNHSPLYSWLKAMHELFRSGGMKEAINLMRFPLTADWLEGQKIEGEVRTWFEDLDCLHTEHLPQSLEDGIYFARKDEKSVAEPLNEVSNLMKRLKGKDFEGELNNLIIQALAEYEFDQSKPEDQSYFQVLPTIGDWMHEMKKVRELNAEERFSLLLGMIAQSSWSKEARENEINLHGWLELPWADASRLIVLGCNDSFLPESLPMDTFIPQSLRRELRLWTDEDRSGRDSYLLHWLLSSHQGNSRIDFVLGKFSRDGSPLKPSPLLFLCNSKDENLLPDRVEKLFGEAPPPQENPAWSYPWKLNPGKYVPIRRISVTSFRSFLACPFRFYLKEKFDMRKLDSQKAEADVMDFGTLVHSTLEALDQERIKKMDRKEIFIELRNRLEDEFFKQYGKNPGLSLRQQKAAIERRLQKVSALHEIDLSKGWEIHRVEEKFHLDTRGSKDPSDWQVLQGKDDHLQTERSVRIVGKIDRIDYHSERGIYRLLDYKTGSKGPDTLHLRGGYARWDEFPEYSRFEVEGKNKRWIDLQLPLYQLWAEKVLLKEGGESVEVGIFNLPAKEEEIGIHSWTELNETLIKQARRCAVGVIEDLIDPADHKPISKVEYDDFEQLFFHSPENATERFIG